MSIDCWGTNPHAWRVRRDQELAYLVTASRHHQQHRTLGRGLDTILGALDAEAAVAGVGLGGCYRRVVRRPAATRLRDRPRGHGLTRHQRLDGGRVRLPFGAVDQSGEHDADRIQRSGRHRPAEPFGDHGQIRKTTVRDAAAAQFLRNEQTGPPQLSGPPPPRGIERFTRGMQLPDAAERRFFE